MKRAAVILAAIFAACAAQRLGQVTGYSAATWTASDGTLLFQGQYQMPGCTAKGVNTVALCNTLPTPLGSMSGRRKICIQNEGPPAIWIGNGPQVVAAYAGISSIDAGSFVDGGPGIPGLELGGNMATPYCVDVQYEPNLQFWCVTAASTLQDGGTGGGWTSVWECQ